MSVKKKQKKAAVIGAVTLAAALLLTGTYAWNSISQKAKNENVVYTNPGGRLHDDWNGTKKMVYVENFTGAKYDAQGELVVDGTGQPELDSKASDIFVRVKLQQYMEFGEDAGDQTKSNRDATPLVSGTTIDQPDDWPVYRWKESSPFNTYLNMKMASANQTTDYLPTFNKNKMSLIADINGTYEGKTAGDTDHFDDYKAWKKGDTSGLGEKTTTAYYYSEDSDAIPAGKVDTTAGAAVDENPGAETTHKKASEKHSVTTTLGTEKIISMEEWLALPETQQKGNFWVYDEDGWAYWANPVSPNTATGPLLTEVSLKNPLGENCYYAINVVGEFASAGDWGKAADDHSAATGFYLNGITEEGITLLNKISNTLRVDSVAIIGDENVGLGDSASYQAKVTLLGDEIENQKVTWSLEGNTSSETKIDSDGKLTVAANEGADLLKLTAVSDEDGSVKQTKRVNVLRADALTITAAGGATSVQAGATLKFNAQVSYNGTAVRNPVVTWSVSGGTVGRARTAETTTIASDGTLKVSELEEAGTTLTVTAVPVANKSIKNEYTVTLEGPDTVTVTAADNATEVATGETLQFSAEVKKGSSTYTSQGVTWSLSEKTDSKTSISSTGLLTVGEDETVETLTVTAKSKNDTSVSGTKMVTVGNNKVSDTTSTTINGITEGSSSTVTIDNIEFYVLTKDTSKNQALLITKNVIEARQFDAQDNRWMNSSLRTYLNEEWLSTKTELRKGVVEVTLYTVPEYNSEQTVVDETKDKVFLLSEADFMGTQNGVTVTNNQLYTTGSKIPKIAGQTGNNAWVVGGASPWWWLRSPRVHSTGVGNVSPANGVWYDYVCTNSTGGVRPSLWVRY